MKFSPEALCGGYIVRRVHFLLGPHGDASNKGTFSSWLCVVQIFSLKEIGSEE